MTIKTLSNITVTPELAKEWLGKNKNVRIMMRRAVDEYERDMRLGLWRDCAQDICFHANGHLVDGQHRLTAQVRCGITLRYNVKTGLEDADVMALDRGRVRGVNVFLKLPAHAPAAIRQLLIAEVGTNTSFSVSQIRDVSDAIGMDVLGIYCAGAGGRLTSPFRAAFVLAHPCDPELVEGVFQLLLRKESDLSGLTRDVSPAFRTTFGTMLAAASHRIETGSQEAFSAQGTFLRACTGIEALLSDRSLLMLKVSRATGYAPLREKRALMGAPESFAKLIGK